MSETLENDKSTTPETDSQLRTFDSLTKYGKRFTNRTGQVNADFARRLERQRDDALAEIEGWRNKWKYAVDMAARAELCHDEWYQKCHANAVLVLDAREERDEWRECAEELALAIRRDDETTDAALEIFDKLKLKKASK